MAADVSTKEPDQVRAGDTIKWEKELADYPADDSWVLKYSFRGNSATIDLTASASGSKHAITIAAATSTAYTSGVYDVLGFVEKGSERYTVYSGTIEILADLEAAGSTYDGRTHVKKTLDAIEAVLENRATKEILESNIEGVSIKRIPHTDLIIMRGRYLAWHKEEQAAENIKLGMGTGRNIFTRFGPSTSTNKLPTV